MAERIVKLTEEQAKHLLRSLKKRDATSRVLAELIDQVAESIVESEDSFWEQVFSIAVADRKTQTCTVKHIEQVIVVKDIDPAEKT